MKAKVCVMMTAMLLGSASSTFADQMIEDFDNVVIGSQWGGGEWGTWPTDLFRQGTTAAGDPVYAGSGSGVVYHDNHCLPEGACEAWGVNTYLSSTLATPIDISAEAASGGAVSIMMHVDTDEDSAALSFMKLSTAYYTSEWLWTEKGGGEFGSNGQTYDIGWNEVIIPLADFIESSTNTDTPDWSNITRIELGTSSGGGWSTNPTDVVFDNWMVIGVVPEPSSIALLGMGGLGLFLRRRR